MGALYPTFLICRYCAVAFFVKSPTRTNTFIMLSPKKGSSKGAAFLIFATWSKYIMYLRSIWIVSEDIKNAEMDQIGTNYEPFNFLK